MTDHRKYPSWLDEVDVKAIPAQVVVEAKDVFNFDNLAEAQKQFPEIDPYKHSKKFTWAMRGEIDGKPALRFEDWTTYGLLSI